MYKGKRRVLFSNKDVQSMFDIWTIITALFDSI